MRNNFFKILAEHPSRGQAFTGGVVGVDNIAEAKLITNELVEQGLNKKKLSKLLALFTGKKSKSIYQSLF